MYQYLPRDHGQKNVHVIFRYDNLRQEQLQTVKLVAKVDKINPWHI